MRLSVETAVPPPICSRSFTTSCGGSPPCAWPRNRLITLSATALVHEAFLKLVGPTDDALWDGRGHFFAAAAIAMRRILVDAARRKQTEKHGGGRAQVALEEITDLPPSNTRLVELDAALNR